MLGFAVYGISGVIGSALIYGASKYISGRRAKKNDDVPLHDVYMASDGSPRYRRNHVGLPIDEVYNFNSEEERPTR
jgi:hypothetical protein